VATRTLDDHQPRGAAATVDHLYVVVGAGRAEGGARWSLDRIHDIEIGRGSLREARRIGDGALRVDVPDPWMSSQHLRFEHGPSNWFAVDAGSRNGMRVNGTKQERVIVGAGDVIEVGRSFFMLRTGEPRGAPALDLAHPRDPLATLDPALSQRFDELRRIAASQLPVVLGGPTGSGKERVARAIHAASGRTGAFVPVNCGALPAGLVESELFGHRRGAFSGAIADHLGLVAAADRGTLFLDEIGDMPPAAQAALLRVLEEHEVRAIGATTATRVDLRVVAATHHDLDELVALGKFREDLFARLAGFELELPPLGDRRVDLGVMLAEIAPASTAFTAPWARALLAYDWPRNVRELVQTVERAVALAAGAELGPEHLPDDIAHARWPEAAPPPDDTRRDQLVALLVKHKGNVTRVAAELGHVRQQVQRWLKRYKLDPASYRS